jgi:hypothetical protein
MSNRLYLVEHAVNGQIEDKGITIDFTRSNADIRGYKYSIHQTYDEKSATLIVAFSSKYGIDAGRFDRLRSTMKKAGFKLNQILGYEIDSEVCAFVEFSITERQFIMGYRIP